MLTLRRITLSSLLLFAFVSGGLAALFGLAPRPARAGAITINETFGNPTAPNWALLGDALLTGNGTIDPVGAGWLRLTGASTNRAGSAIYEQPLSSIAGLQVSFDYASYGGTGADGFSFYLIDGATAAPTVGAPGGGLGYAQRKTDYFSGPGVTNGYIGIGFDELGNFTTKDSGGCYIPCGISPDTVSIRGSGSLDAVDAFKLFTKSTLGQRSVDGVERGNTRRVRITILNQVITVEIDFGSGYEKIIDAFDLKTAPGQATIPATLKIGFSGATGDLMNYHEIRNLTVRGAQISTTSVSQTLNPVPEGQPVTFTTTVSGGSGTPTGTVTFMDEQTAIGSALLNSSGQAQITTTALPNGTHSITAAYEGDSVYGASVSSPAMQVIYGPDLTISQTYDIRMVNQFTYTITARNSGPSDADGAMIADSFPAPLANETWSWTCSAAGGAACGAPSGTGNLNHALSALPPGGSVVFTITGSIANPAYWTNTATITTPVGRNDRDLRNNSYTVGRWALLLPLIIK